MVGQRGRHDDVLIYSSGTTRKVASHTSKISGDSSQLCCNLAMVVHSILSRLQDSSQNYVSRLYCCNKGREVPLESFIMQQAYFTWGLTQRIQVLLFRIGRVKSIKPFGLVSAS
jgi:hypothetical protein